VTGAEIVTTLMQSENAIPNVAQVEVPSHLAEARDQTLKIARPG